MKFNWGTGITIFIVCFVGFILTMVYKATSLDHHLVAEDYYDQEIKFQELINKKKNSANFGYTLNLEQLNGMLIVDLGEKLKNIQNGTVVLYKIDEVKDGVLNLKTDHEGKQYIVLEPFKKGRYLIKVNFKQNDKLFYLEKETSFN